MATASSHPTVPPQPSTILAQRMQTLNDWLHQPRGHPKPVRDVTRWLRILGSGLIISAADDDPSGIGTYSQIGAALGAGLLWLVPYMLPLMFAVQEMCGRISMVTGQGIAGVVKGLTPVAWNSR